MTKTHRKIIAYTIAIMTPVLYATYVVWLYGFYSVGISYMKNRSFFDTEVYIDDDAGVFMSLWCPNGRLVLSGSTRIAKLSEAYRLQYVEYPCDDTAFLKEMRKQPRR